jgi:hypothetical protein
MRSRGRIDRRGLGEPDAGIGEVLQPKVGVSRIQRRVVPARVEACGLGVQLDGSSQVGPSEGGLGVAVGSLRLGLAVVGVADRERDASEDRADQRLGIGAECSLDVCTVVSQSLSALDLFDRMEMDLHPVGRVREGGFLGEEARTATLGED